MVVVYAGSRVVRSSRGGYKPQNFGAEIFPAVRPPDTAARNPATAQMDAFHARAVNEDFDVGPGQRQFVHIAAADLERDVGFRFAVVSGLVKICPQRGLDDIQEPPQNPVFVQVFYRVQPFADLADDGSRRLIPAGPGVGVEPGLE